MVINIIANVIGIAVAVVANIATTINIIRQAHRTVVALHANTACKVHGGARRDASYKRLA